MRRTEPATYAPCGCQAGSGRSITDLERHTAWHTTVVEQGGPAGAVDLVALRGARGFTTETLAAETVVDRRARESGRRASGALRRASA